MSIEEQAAVDAPVIYKEPEPETQTAELDPATTDENQTEESSTSEDHQDDSPEKPPRGVQKRLNELTREKYEERRRADRLEEMLTQILPRLLPADQQQDMQSRNPYEKPDPNQYPAGRYDPDYLEALTDYKVALRFEGQQRQAEQARQQAEFQQKQHSLAQAEQEFARTVPDYAQAREALVSIPHIANHQGIGMAVANSETPAALVHYLGTHLDEAVQIAMLDPLAAAMRLGRIEATLGKTAPATAETVATTNAPAPVKPLKGSGGSFVPRSSAEARDIDEYVRLREKEIAAGRR